jgi:hypothetical protein
MPMADTRNGLSASILGSTGQERSEPKRKMPKAFLALVKKTNYAINGSELPVRRLGRAIDARLPIAQFYSLFIIVVVIIASILFEPIIIAIHLRSRNIV